MLNETVHRIRAGAENTLIEAAWAQWTALTAAAIPAGRRFVWTIVDPEALVLASLAVGHRERRLDDMVASLAADTAHLMSMHRMRSLASRFPLAVQGRLGTFAEPAIAGGDRRWKRLAVAAPAEEYAPRSKPLGDLRLLEGPALTLRLRAGFGVNAKADLLSLLLGLAGTAADLKVIAAATAYTERALRTATDEMSLAGFIHEIEGRPSSYYTEPGAWGQVLQTYRTNGEVLQMEPAFPPWRFWPAVFVFLAQVIEWADASESEDWSAYVASSRARDILADHQPRLRQAQVGLPSLGPARGAEFLQDFERVVRRIETWTDEGLFGSA